MRKIRLEDTNLKEKLINIIDLNFRYILDPQMRKKRNINMVFIKVDEVKRPIKD